MDLFCTDVEWLALKRTERRRTAAFLIPALLTPVLFVTLCLLIRTGNARVMHAALLGTTGVLGGCAVTVYLLLLRPARQELKHLEMLRTGEKTYPEGRLTVTEDSFRIPRSVRVRRVLLETGGTDERPVMLNVDERWVNRMPPNGSRIRAAAVHSYLAGVETIEASDGQMAQSRKTSRIRSFFRGVSLVTPPLVLWLFFTVIFGSFVFYRITDTDPSRKIMIFADGVTAGEDQLAARLEEQLGDPIRMVRIHPFSYMMFGGEELKTADLYILPDSHTAQYREWLVPGDEGILLFDPSDGTAVAGDVFLYTENENAPEPYRLYLGARSPHLEDGMAAQAAEALIRMETGEEGDQE